MNTGQLPAISPSSGSGLPARGRPRETSVDELFSAFGTGSGSGSGFTASYAVSSGGAAVAEAPRIVIDDDGARFAPTGSASDRDPQLDGELDRAERAAADDARHAPAHRARPDVGAAAGAGRLSTALHRLAGRSPARTQAEDPAAAPRSAPRLIVVADTSGPRVRLGVLWCAVGVLSLWLGAVPALVLFAPLAAVAAIQTGSSLRRARRRSRPLVAGLCAFVVTLAGAAPSSRVVGLAMLIAVVGTLISALHLGGFDVESAGATVRSWLAVSLAAVAPVLFTRVDTALGLLLFLLVCSYDAGDFLVGTASSNWFEGPLAGMVGVAAMGCGAAVVHPGALTHYSIWPAVVLTALACPLGQLLASATLPQAGAFAPALRRLDSLILVGPLWILLFSRS